MTCSNIGADILGAEKPMIAFDRSRKSRSDAGDSVRSDSVNSDKIHANSIDSNRSNSRNSMCAADMTTNCSSSGQKISFKPYEDSPKSGVVRDQQQHRPSKPNGASNNHNSHHNGQEESCGINSRKRSSDTVSPKRSPGGSSPKRSSSSSSHFENHKNSSSSASSSSPSNVISYTSTGLLELSKNHQLSKAVCDSSPSGFPSAAQLSHFPPAMSHHNHDHHNSSHPYNSSSACRDPFCSGCHLSSLPGMASAGNCCNGLSTCTHTKAAASAADHPFASYPPGINPLTHHLDRFSNGMPSQKPFPCHWTANGSYCGKSFSTCEELLQHLKSHTLGTSVTSPYSGLSSYYSQVLGSPNARYSSLEEFRYHPYKLSGGASPATFRPLARMPPSSGFPLVPPPLSMYQPGYQSSLSSYYALLNSRLAGPGSLH